MIGVNSNGEPMQQVGHPKLGLVDTRAPTEAERESGKRYGPRAAELRGAKALDLPPGADTRVQGVILLALCADGEVRQVLLRDNDRLARKILATVTHMMGGKIHLDRTPLNLVNKYPKAVAAPVRPWWHLGRWVAIWEALTKPNHEMSP